MGNALATIQRERLYRETHATFEQYCQEKWDVGRQHAYRLIDAAGVVKDLSPNGDADTKAGTRQVCLPGTESQARALAKIKEPEQRRETWEKLLKTAPLDDAGNVVITAKLIEEQVADVLGEPKKKNPASRAVPGPGKGSGKEVVSDFQHELGDMRREIKALADRWTAKFQRQEIVKTLSAMIKVVKPR